MTPDVVIGDRLHPESHAAIEVTPTRSLFWPGGDAATAPTEAVA